MSHDTSSNLKQQRRKLHILRKNLRLAAQVRQEVGEEEWRVLCRFSWAAAGVRVILAALIVLVAVSLFRFILGFLLMPLAIALGSKAPQSVTHAYHLYPLLAGVAVFLIIILSVIEHGLDRMIRQRLENALPHRRGYESVLKILPPYIGLQRGDLTEEERAIAQSDPRFRFWLSLRYVLSIVAIIFFGISFIFGAIGYGARDEEWAWTVKALTRELIPWFWWVFFASLVPVAAALGTVHLYIRKRILIMFQEELRNAE